MGMFDSVIFICPDCNGTVEFQSKAGHCTLDDFHNGFAPPVIAADIEGDIVECDSCDSKFEAKVVQVIPALVPVQLKKV